MLKRLSLRARLTLLSALVTAGVAVCLTAVFLFGADRIFLHNLQEELVFHTVPIQPAGPVSLEAEAPRSAEVGVPVKHNGSPLENPVAVFEPESAQAETVEAIQITLTQAGRRFNLWGIAGLALVTLLGAGATWLMAGRALRPVQELSEVIGEIGGSDFSRRVEVCGRQDEISRLAQSFNAMMDKVGASFERQRRFSANAAHELKTPLATIQVGLDVLELDEHPTPARMEKALAVARANTSRMIRLVDDLFRLSFDGECKLDEEVPLSALFCEVLAELSPQLKARGLSASAKADPSCRLTGSRTMLYRALYNLAENAVKYNREGGSLSLYAKREENAVIVQVSDTGIGIPADELAQVFEPFYRVDRSRSRAVGGSGLGLSLVQEIVERHGGRIAVESVPGEGTTFFLRFPGAQTVEKVKSE